MNSILKFAVNNNSFVSNNVYKLILFQSNIVLPGSGPVLLRFFCMCYNKLLNEKNKKIIDTFINNNFKNEYSKYEIITASCRSEKIDIQKFINDNNKYIKPVFEKLGIQFNIDSLQKYLDGSDPLTKKSNIEKIIDLLNSYKQKISIIFKGGKSRKLRKKLNFIKTYKK